MQVARNSALRTSRRRRLVVKDGADIGSVSKDEWHQRGLVVLPAMQSIVRRRRGACHRAALCADPLAPPHHEGLWLRRLPSPAAEIPACSNSSRQFDSRTSSRTTVATNLIRRGVPQAHADEVAGHKSKARKTAFENDDRGATLKILKDALDMLVLPVDIDALVTAAARAQN